MRHLFSSAISQSVKKERRSCHRRWCRLQLLQHEVRIHGGIKKIAWSRELLLQCYHISGIPLKQYSISEQTFVKKNAEVIRR